MNDTFRNPLHSLYDCLPILGEFLHASIVKINTVSVELAIRLSTLVGQIVIRADNHIVIVNKVCSKTICKCFS